MSFSVSYLINANKVVKVIIFPVTGINNTKQTMRCFPKSALSVCPAEWNVARASPTSLCPWTAPSPSAAGANTLLTSTVQHLDFPVTRVSYCWACSILCQETQQEQHVRDLCSAQGIGYVLHLSPMCVFILEEGWGVGRKAALFAQEGLVQHP